jgi:ATP-binding cassette subfamily F protein uup
LTLRRALAPDSDAVIYQGSVIHVAAWAARFLFDPEDLNQRVGKLSGGERARVLTSQLMLQEADVLLLDEPTNDLDIPTLEILEESLLEFKGALVLVTHDRYMLDRVSTIVLGFDGTGGAERFADYSQWDAWQKKQISARNKSLKSQGSAQRLPQTGNGNGTKHQVAITISKAESPSESTPRKKLSYQEAREFANMEETIAQAEAELSTRRDALAEPQLASDGQRLLETCAQMEEAQRTVDRLYARWAELAAKKD